MSKPTIPSTDSIEKLARFWDSHDLTDFEDQLDAVESPVFVRGTSIKVNLPAGKARAVAKIAQSRGVSREELIGRWIDQGLSRLGKRAESK